MSTSSTPVDRIRLSGLSARGYHGVLGSEREEGQLFVADVVLGLGPRGTAVAAVTDSIDDAVDYAEVACAVVAVIEGEPVNLIETLACRVADVVLGFGRVQEVEVTIHKPQAPVPVAFEDVTVTITRTAQDADGSLTGVAEGRADGGADLPAWSASVPAAVEAPTAAEPVVAPVGAAVPVVAPLLAGGLLGDVAGAAPAAHAEDPVPGPPLSEEPVEEVGVAQAWAEDAGAPEAWAEDAGVSAAQPEPVDEPAEAPALPAVPLPEDEPADGPQAGGWWTEAAGEPEAWAEDAGAPAAQPEPVDEPAEEPVVAPVPAPAEDLVPVEDPAAGGAGLWPDPAAAPVETGTALGTAGLASGLGAGALAAGAALVPGAVVDPAVDPAEEAAAPVAADADEAPAPGWGDEPAEPTDAAEPAALAETSDPLLPEPAAPPVNEPGPLGAAVPLAQPPAEAPVDPLSLRPAAPAQVVLALGANVGKVVPTLRTAVRALSSLEGLTVTAVAPLARTTAVTIPGTEPQPDYLNTVLLATTTMTPRELHEVCQDLEAAAGRVRTAPWGPRTLDIDLISFEGVTSDDPALTLPHPRAAERAFVLVPWSTADPFAELDGRSVAALAEAAPDRGGLRWLALDWLDSDRLPALPTGQYVVPPTDDQVPAPEGTPAPEPAPAPVAEAVPAPVLPAAEPVAPAPVPAPAEPVAPAAPAAAPVHQPEPAAPQAPAAPAEPVFSPGPAPEDDWAAPMGWDDVIGGNRS